MAEPWEEYAAEKDAGPWQDYATTTTPQPTPPATEQHGPAYRAAAGFLEGINPLPAIQATLDPMLGEGGRVTPGSVLGGLTAIPRAIGEQSINKLQAARQALGKGQYGEALASGLEAVPIAGQMAQSVSSKINEGNYAGAGGAAAAALLPVGARFVPGLRVPLRSRLPAAEQEAVAWAGERGIPIDVAAASGNPALTGMKKALEWQPFTAGKMRDFRNAQEAAMAETGRGLAAETAPAGARTPIEAGERVRSGLESRVGALRGEANTAYDRFRQGAEGATKQRQVGVRTSTSPILDERGNPIVTETPIIKSIALPVDIRGAKAALQPIADALEEALPEAQKQASPGLTTLRQFLKQPDAISAPDAETALSALKKLARSSRDEVPLVRDRSQGIAAAAVRTLQPVIDDAVANASPEVAEALQQGRTAARSMHKADKLVSRTLPAEPVQTFDKLTRNNDRAISTLRELQRTDPGQVAGLGRSLVEDILNQAEAKGSVFKGGQAAAARWEKLGNETKKILYGDRARDLNQYFRTLRMLSENPNPSGSGVILALWDTVRTIAAAPLHPLEAAKLGTRAIASRVMADALLSPRGPEMVQQGLPLPTQGVARWGGRGAVASAIGQPPAIPPMLSEEDQDRLAGLRSAP